jgi:hypothetical protein
MVTVIQRKFLDQQGCILGHNLSIVNNYDRE